MAFGGAWAGLAKCLGDRLTLVAPDMPSHGRSADWDGSSSFADTVYAAALSVMGDEPLDIIGHSFGAATALRLAVEHPGRIRSVTMFEPVFFAVALADAPDAVVDHDARAADFFAAIARGDRPLAARAFNRMWSDGAPWDSLPERTREAMTRAIHVVPDTMRFLYDDCAGILAPGVLEAVATPTLLLRGELAIPAVIATNDGLARRMADAQQAVIAGAGHMAPISHPAGVAEAIAPLLARS